MALFGKKNEVDSVPEEVREYYQSEKRERTGLAWLLAVGTLVVTLILAAGLFFGGRWAYRKVTNNDDKKAPIATQTQKQTTAKTEDKPSQAKPQATTPPKSTGTTTPTAASTSTPSTSGSTTQTTPTTNTTPTSNPSAASTQTTLVNTGPADVVAIFVVIVIAGTLYHRFILSKLS